MLGVDAVMSGGRRTLVLEHALLPHGWARRVRVDVEAGLILAVSEGDAPDDAEHVAGIALPGMVNLHSHTFQRAMAGRAERRGQDSDSFWTWRQVMYGFLERLSPDDVEAIAAFAMMEMLEGGFTSVAEFHYLHHDPAGLPYANPAELCTRIAAAAVETGIGLTLLPVLYAHGGFGGLPPHDGQRRFINDLDGFVRLLDGAADAVADVPDGMLGVAPHSLRAVTPAQLTGLLAAVPRGPVHMHIAEQIKEVEDCLTWSGQRPVDWLLSHVPVDDRWCLVHATHTDAAERRGIAARLAVVGLCPITEANLGDGVFEAAAFRAAAGRFGIGSDSNIELPAAGELRMLEYSQRLTQRARNVLADGAGASTGRSLYEAALAGGAQAVGRRVGCLAPGQRADFVVLDGNHPDLAATFGDGWLDALVFVASPGMISRVLVGGRTVVERGRHCARGAISRRYGAALRRLVAK